MREKLLIIDDDRVFCELLKRHFEEEYAVTAFTDPEDAVKHIRGNSVDVILTDLSMPKIDGLEILKIAKSETFNTDVIIMTAYARVDTAVEAMKKGAYDYIIKPFSLDELSLQLKNLFEKRGLLKENVSLRKFVETTYRPQNMIGESKEMKEVYRFVEQVSPTDATVLITGESGTGKELIARAIHFSGNRKDRSLVSINCTAIPETLLESELFGYTKGAFTGAGKDRDGLFVHAEGGTIFLDEIVDASLPIQAKLLRTLQEHTIRPLGGNKEIPVDARVICATNRDINQMILENKFRADLYHRINVISVHIPPLRERSGDIPLLVKHFLKGMKKIHPRAVEMLSRCNWPGNVRELKNLVERLVVFSDADTIMPNDIPLSETGMPYLTEDDKFSYNEAKRKITDEFNRAIINKALLKHNGNVTKAAEVLKLDRANFQRLMRKYGISSREFKE
ncbi:MAG: sigma-54-dependent Fis family transcriptional regulator [Nitrospirae bacterium]|nr:sigma-54-dependent Fis family transcriptional regulator [Nitrospirota bacterium]